MKHILLLSAMIFAAPVWAAETTAAPAAAQASTQAEPAVQPGHKAKKRKHAKKKNAAALICPAGCSAMVCGGVTVCVKNKPAPYCTPC